jgi:TRAP-type mannitol/chloroaromatic compound transport system permease large subunit/TRAP-type mannitol/chloroaromatic compound transport system permease small subunit
MAEEQVSDKLDITDESIAERRAEAPGQTPEDMTAWQRPITAAIDVLNNWVGRIICLLLVPLIFVMVFEVVSRKAFAVLVSYDMGDTARAIGLGPTLWAFDISRMLGGVLFMTAAAYALMRGVHIRADFLYRSWTPKTQATVDATLYLAFYFPAMLFFFWSAFDFWWSAFQSGEQAGDSTWAPILWPARTAMPVGAFLLFLQGFPELFRCFHQMGKEREARFVKILVPYFIVLAVVFYLAFFQDDLYRSVRRVEDPTLWQSLIIGIDSTLDGLGDAFSFLDFSRPTIGLIMLAVMLFSIFIGFPISFTLIFLAFVFGSWGTNFDLTAYLLTLKVNTDMLSTQLVAVPLFIFMGIMMEQAGLMERLFNAIQMMMSRTRGALFIAVLFVSTIFAAATGIVGASVTILGIMAARTMNRSGYDVRLAAGTITAGGTLGILIPPSIMLIVMGPVLEIDVITLFQAAIIPGVLLAFLYIVYSVGRCLLDPSLGPILPKEEQPETSPYYILEVIAVLGSIAVLVWLMFVGTNSGFNLFPLDGFIIPLLWLGIMFGVYKVMRDVQPGGFYLSDLWYEFFMGLVPPTILIAFALGSILAGWATPSEAAACGAFGALLLSIGYRKFSIAGFYDAMIKTLEITVLIMFLVAASNFFGGVFSNLGTPKFLTELLLSYELSAVTMLIFIMALVFLLGWPLEWVPIVVIIVPILVPLLTDLQINLTWFAILVAVNLQTAWLSPPVALSAYFLKGVVPEWDLKDIYLGMMQFMVIQMIGLILIFMFPGFALWLPDYLSAGGSEGFFSYVTIGQP